MSLPTTQRCLCLLLACVLLPATATAAGNEAAARKAVTASQPKAGPTKTLTSFSAALSCMDEMFATFGKRDIVITSLGIPDDTGKVRTGTKDMMITALSKMSLKSGAFVFVDLHSLGGDLGQLFALRGDTIKRIPDYYIRGSITQLDESITHRKIAGGVGAGNDKEGPSLASIALGVSRDEISDLISMDMSIGDAAERRVLMETVTANTMVMTKESTGGEGGNTFGKLGLSFSLDKSQIQGVGATTRALLELNLIEALGKFTRVPYWLCLGVDASNPVVRGQAETVFYKMKEHERVLFIQRKLGGDMRRYRGPIDGLMNAELTQAIAEYQAAVGLIAHGRIDFDLYVSLIDDTQNALAALPALPTPATSAK